MSEHIDNIIQIINAVYSESQLTDESFKHLRTVENALSQLGEPARAAVSDYYRKAAWPPDNQLSLVLYLYKVLNFNDGGSFLSQKLDYNIEKISSVNDFSEIFWNLARINFTKTSNTLHSALLRECFCDVSDTLKNFLKQNITFEATNSKKINRVAIVSPQILGMRHSPTREAINIACHLERYHNCEVFILNTNGMNYTNDLYIFDPFIANHANNFKGKQLVKIDYMEFKNKDINLISFPADRMSVRKVLDILQTLSSLKIDAVIAHGENLFIQDAIHQMLPSIFATTGGVVPFAHSDAYWVPGNLFSEQSRKVAAQYGHEDFMKETMLVTPEGRAEKAADKSVFSLPDDAVVYLVVSTRMADEIDSDFSAMCTKLLKNNPKAYILLAGTNNIDPCLLFDENMVHVRRIINVGFQDDLPAISLMADVYLNPLRQGGGTSSQTAILNGLPDVTMDYGHISAVVPENHRFGCWENYLSYAVRLGEDKFFLKQEQNLYMKHFSSRLQSKVQIEKIYNKLQTIAEEKYS